VIGEAATVALAEEFAGTRLYIPKRVRDGNQITRAIGREAAAALKCDALRSEWRKLVAGAVLLKIALDGELDHSCYPHAIRISRPANLAG